MAATARALEHLVRPLRRRHRVAWVAAGIGAAALVLGGGAWLVRLGAIEAPWWVLAAWAGALLAVTATLVVAWRQELTLRLPVLARTLEESGSWRRGSLVSLLESPAAGTSEALLGLADEALASEVAARGGVAAQPLWRGAGTRLAAGGGLLGLGLFTLGAAGPAGEFQ